MMLSQLYISNFKNIPEASLDFSHNVNAFLGHNGMGKSNLLDAIYTLSFCKSFTGINDAQLVRRDEPFAMLRGDYIRRGQAEQITMGIQPGRRKSLKRQGKEYRRLSEHIGQLPLVLISPRDMEIVNGTSDERRRFVDIIISQTDSVYLQRLMDYNNALQQRNRLLRDNADDSDLFDAIEASMAFNAAYISDRRRDFIDRFADIFTRHYRDIARTDETPSLTYRSQIVDAAANNANDTAADPAEMLRLSRRRDFIIGHTTVGPHRDDLILALDDMPVRTAASQGQSKTFTIAMRMAQYEFLAHATQMRPLLLLDDIFDKLDSSRVANIVDIVNRDIFGQIFITDTNRDHLDSIMALTGNDYRLWQVDAGRFTPLSHNSLTE